jgi:1-acyl-sn-glycerol-3-phosphate acyltransferase
VAEKAIRNGRTILVLPGGEAEQLLTQQFTEKVRLGKGEKGSTTCHLLTQPNPRSTSLITQVYLKKRKGFVKLALKHNLPLVPAYVFGSNDLYTTSNSFFDARWALMKRFGVCLPLCKGYFKTPFCPLPIKNTIVFGEPIKLPKIENGECSPEQLNEAHELFTIELKKLFDKNKARFGMGDRELVIV